MKIIEEIKLDFDDVLLLPQRSTLKSRQEANLIREFKFYHSTRIWSGIPIFCSNMSFASWDIAIALAKHKICTCLHKYHDILDIKKHLTLELAPYIWISIGYGNQDQKTVYELCNQELVKPNICIDVANAHIDDFVSYCKIIRNLAPDSIIMAGNVVNPSSSQELITHGGVDIVKVGIGQGSACSTRFLTGCGYPQLSACMDNSHVTHGLKQEERKHGLICSDGGCRYPGDVIKAFCGGADFVMLGGYFCGTNESHGEWDDKRENFTYYGMSTHHMQEKFSNGKKNYRASEGTKISVKNKGPVDNVVQELLGGIRSACSYIGATSIKDMSKCAVFQKVNSIHNNKNPMLGV